LRAVQTMLRQRSPGAPASARFGAAGEEEFHPAVDLDATDITAVQKKCRRRGLRWLHRHGLECMVRYCARPLLTQERLGRLNDELLMYRLRRPTLDGRTELTLTPLELTDRLAHLVTPPRIHKHRYCGALALNAKLRRAVTTSAGPA